LHGDADGMDNPPMLELEAENRGPKEA